MRAQDWPWIFEKGGESSLIISTLEVLAILLALKVSTESHLGLIVPVSPSFPPRQTTDAAAVNKLMTAKSPASAVLMELSSYMKTQVYESPSGLVLPFKEQGSRPVCLWETQKLRLIFTGSNWRGDSGLGRTVKPKIVS